jgi:hypothetical protein
MAISPYPLSLPELARQSIGARLRPHEAMEMPEQWVLPPEPCGSAFMSPVSYGFLSCQPMRLAPAGTAISGYPAGPYVPMARNPWRVPASVPGLIVATNIHSCLSTAMTFFQFVYDSTGLHLVNPRDFQLSSPASGTAGPESLSLYKLGHRSDAPPESRSTLPWSSLPSTITRVLQPPIPSA